MPNKDAAKKALRQTKTHTAKNNHVRRVVKELVKESISVITAADKIKAQEVLKKTLKALDKAAQARVYTKGNVARRKSRLVKKFNKLGK